MFLRKSKFQLKRDIKVSINIFCPAGTTPAVSSVGQERDTTPSQLRGNQERKNRFLSKKLEKDHARGVEMKAEEILLEDKKDCEKCLPFQNVM